MRPLALLIPFYGPLPNTFPFFIKSALYNPEVDFYFVGVDKENLPSAPNIYALNLTLEEFFKKIESKTGIQVKKNKPYHLCDMRPAYGLVFEELLTNYNYWGHCDIDMIFGDIKKSVFPLLEHGYDKLFENGHLTIYKNSYENNRRFLTKSVNKEFISFLEVAKYPFSFCFDEAGGIDLIYEKAFPNSPFYKNRGLFADIDPFRSGFYSRKDDVCSIYQFKEGKLFELRLINDESCVAIEEKLYAHFQKRKFEKVNIDLDKDFLILPNKVIASVSSSIDSDFIRSANSIDENERIKSLTPPILIRAINKLKRCFYRVPKYPWYQYSNISHS